MKRVMCVYLPHWPLQRLLREQPALRGKAVVLFDPGGPRGPQVVLTSPEAARRGVRPGMPLAEATGIDRNLVACAMSPERDHQALMELAQWAERYSPLVGLEEGPSPQCLLLDITGCAACFRGEDRLLQRAVQDLEREGWTARVAVADTLGAAWGLARFGNERATDGNERESGRAGERATEETFSALPLSHSPAPPLAYLPLSRSPAPPLAYLPAASLRLHADALELLAKLGIERVEQLMALPRDSLLARFGPRVLERLDQALGLLPEVVTPLRFVPPVQATFSFEYPIDNLGVVNRVLDQLTERLQQLLAARNRGARQVECWLYHEIASPWKVEIGLVRPSCSARRLSELLRTRLERVQIEEPITALWLRVTAAEALPDRQEELPFGDERESGGAGERATDGNERGSGGAGERATEETSFVLPLSRSPTPPLAYLPLSRSPAPPLALPPPLALAALLEHLSSRLGREAVTRAALVPDPQPEYACRFEAVIDLTPQPPSLRGTGEKKRKKRTETSLLSPPRFGEGPGEGFRPLHICPRPIPIEVLAIVPEGPPVRLRWSTHDYVVLRAWGPERIETGWWRGEDVHRDYYLVATRTGSRFWIFRRRDDGRWFLQGCFD